METDAKMFLLRHKIKENLCCGYKGNSWPWVLFLDFHWIFVALCNIVVYIYTDTAENTRYLCSTFHFWVLSFIYTWVLPFINMFNQVWDFSTDKEWRWLTVQDKTYFPYVCCWRLRCCKDLVSSVVLAEEI